MVTGSLEPTVLRINPSKRVALLVTSSTRGPHHFKIGGQPNPRVFMSSNCFKTSITHVMGLTKMGR